MRIGEVRLWIPKLLKDSRGTSVLETALIVPTLAMFVMGGSDLAMGFSEKIRMQQAAARAIEMATAGNYASGDLQTEATAAAGVPAEDVTVDRWLECDGVRQTSFDDTCTTSGAQVARFVSISISGSYTPMFSFLVPDSDNGSISISGYSAVRVQ
jgi:Flp pilus assembly protein TadG